MSKRFTDTKKWEDPWYRKLSPEGKLLFNFICDRCDLAGFWEIDIEMAAFSIGYSEEVAGAAFKEISRSYITNDKYIWITRFIEFQGNYPFRAGNRTSRKIAELLQKKERSFKEVKQYLSHFVSPCEGGYKPLTGGAGVFIYKDKEKDTSKAKAYTKEFEEFWAIFKNLDRAESKPLAFGNWQATIKGRGGATGHPPVKTKTLIQAAKHYRDYCLAEGTERKYIMQPSSFLGPKKRGWEGYLKPIKVQKKSKNGIGMVVDTKPGEYSHLGRER